MADEYEERRGYFRVKDSINLSYKQVDESALQAQSHISDDVLSNCSLATALEILNQESQSLGLRLERRDPELVEYLRIIDTKLNLIAQAVAPQDEAFSKKEKKEVSLSASGLAFVSDEMIAVGSLLELRMLLSSLLAVIVVHAHVVDCKAAPTAESQNAHLISVEFVNLSEDDQELLIKHIVKRELQQLREKHKQ